MIDRNCVPRRALAGLCFVLVLVVGTSGRVGAQSLSGGSFHGFVENRGQWDPAASFRGSFGPMDVWLERDGWTVAVEQRTGMGDGPRRSNAGEASPVATARGVVVKMRFAGSAGARPVAEDRLEARHNWISGSNPAGWATDARAFRRVRMAELYPGISAIAREQAGHFEYDVVLDPEADLTAVRLSCEGQDGMAVDEHGALILHTGFGDFRQPAPVAWEESADGSRTPIACEWRLTDGKSFGFEVGGRTPGRRLVIDPGIIWSNLFGGGADENPGLAAIGTSAGGNINVAGVVVSPSFPTTPGAYQTTLQGTGTWDAWVARFSPGGALLWSTFLGGSGNEWARGLAVGPNGTVTVVGATTSTNFPNVNGFDATHNGTGGFNWGDAFLATLDPAQTGTAQLAWSTILGGFNDERLNSVAVDSAGIVTAAGWTYSSNIPGIPPPNAFQPMLQGIQDGIVVRFNPALPPATQLLWFTFLGGSSFDYLGPIALKPNGQVVVHGGTTSANYPVANAFQPAIAAAGTWDTMISILDPSQPPAGQLVWSSYFGGNFNENENALEVDAAGRITVGGWTNSPSFPTTAGAFDTSANGGSDGFLARIDPALAPASQLLFSTLIGGSNDDGINDLYLDGSGTIHAVGSTASPNLPTTPGSFQPSFQGGAPAGWGPYDGFACVLDPSGTALLYSSYIGGAVAYDFAYNVVKDACGAAIISGLTRSSDFPHTNGNYSALDDVFLLKMELLPAGVSRYGSSTAGCAGPLEIGVTSVPSSGSTTFAITCGGAPPLGSGLLAISGAPLASPLVVSGLSVWINPANPTLYLFPATANAAGFSVVPMPVPSGPGTVGAMGYAQFGWADPCAPGGLAGSCALSVTIQ